MIFSRKKLADPRVKWLAACTLFVLLALYSFYRSSLFRDKGAQSKAGHGQSAQDPALKPPDLQINAVVLHGHIAEIEGSTDPGAVVMINGETASTIFGRNEFRHFLGPLPSGTTIITVTSQDERGGVNTQQVAASIER